MTPFVPRSRWTSEAPAIHHARLRRRRLCASRRQDVSRRLWPARQRSIDRFAKVVPMELQGSLTLVARQGCRAVWDWLARYTHPCGGALKRDNGACEDRKSVV